MADFKKYIPETDIYLFNTGEAQTAYNLFGCHYVEKKGAHRFCLWAPGARSVSIVGDFNGWDEEANRMELYKHGVWAAFVAGLKVGDNYKYMIYGYDGSRAFKADPFAFSSEIRPGSASKVWHLDGYEWHDGRYMRERTRKNHFNNPVSIYEVHLGSWKKAADGGFPNYRDTADELCEYLVNLGYTHVQAMPVMEYPLDDSWGYQTTGYYAPTSRYGTPWDFMYFVDKMHSKGIGVILEWTPGHFPRDEQGLAHFDGTWLYEHENASIREHPLMGTYLFNFNKPEVQSFLVSNAVFWMEKYHADGLMMGSVTPALYFDYGRGGYYTASSQDGEVDRGAVEFFKKVNSVVLTRYAGALTAAEEVTSYPMLTKPPYDGGLGFSFKWNTGFSYDALNYLSMDHYFRQFEHGKMNFLMYYAFYENYILAFSHEMVSNGKASIINKIYGDYWQKFASLRALYGFMFAQPGKKLMFMGGEFAQFLEWDHVRQLDWFLMEYESHAGVKKYVKRLNSIYRSNPALYEVDDGPDGFMWLNAGDKELSAFAFMRMSPKNNIVCVANFTAIVRENYVVALPAAGELKLILNSDNAMFGGSGVSAVRAVKATRESVNGLPCGAAVKLPPLAALYYEFIPENDWTREKSE